jgi:hypothetical protein
MKGVSLSDSELAALPGLTVGTSISIQGRLVDVNRLLRGVFYFAPNGTSGNATFTVTVTDKAVSRADGAHPFTLPLTLSSLQPSLGNLARQAFYRSPAPVLPLLFPDGTNLTASGNMSDALYSADTNQSYTVSASVPIFIQAVNQPPSVLLESASFYADSDQRTLVPAITIYDQDHNASTLVSSFGVAQLPPVSVVVTVGRGRVSFRLLDGVGLSQGTGTLDRVAALRGPLGDVNAALAAVYYTCRSVDGCAAGANDTISVLADDEGFTGRGGPLTAEATILVLL